MPTKRYLKALNSFKGVYVFRYLCIYCEHVKDSIYDRHLGSKGAIADIAHLRMVACHGSRPTRRNRPRAEERGEAAVAGEITFQRKAREVIGGWQWVAFVVVLLGLWLSGGLAPIDRKLPSLLYSIAGWLLENWVFSGYFVGKFFEWICKRTFGKWWLVAISAVLVFPTWLVHRKMDQI